MQEFNYSKKLDTVNRPDWTTDLSRDNSKLWLDKNENTDNEYLSLLKTKVIDACGEQIGLYPECYVLYKKLAKTINVSPENLICGAGSDGIIRYAFEAFVNTGDTVIYTHPTFAMYDVYCKIFGANPHKVPYSITEDGPNLDINQYLKAIRDKKPKLVCLPNPDSPTGTMVSHLDLINIIETSQQVRAIVLIDEAYYPYTSYTALPLIKSYSNLLITRTFSKAWGLAGARVGYGLASHNTMKIIHKVRPMYEIGAVSQAIILKALDYEAEMLASVARLNAGKDYFVSEMQTLGFKTLTTYGNFQHVAFGSQAEIIHKELAGIALYRKDFPNTALEGYSRFSLTTVDNFRTIVAAIKVALSPVKKINCTKDKISV